MRYPITNYARSGGTDLVLGGGGTIGDVVQGPRRGLPRILVPTDLYILNPLPLLMSKRGGCHGFT